MNPAKRHNVTLIGMPGSGKTTIGQQLAAHWGWTFFDTDQFIERGERRTLEQIIDVVGHAAFLKVEAQYVRQVAGTGQVISTGGSVVYDADAMRHLQRISTVVYLNVPLPELERRLGNLKTRGVVIAPGMTVADLWRQRHPLYEQYADVRVPCSGDVPSTCAQAVIVAVEMSGAWAQPGRA
jgi:shikimate kinase